MSTTYEIFADEAWTHGTLPLNRYWCFHGGIMGLQPDLDRLDTELRAIKAAHGVHGEIKWANLSASNIGCCMAMVDCLFKHIRHHGIRYRQMFLDRALVRIPPPGEAPLTDLDIQYKLCYQFLKHHFGLKHLPPVPAGHHHTVLIRLDDHSSQKHKKQLATFAVALPTYLSRPDLIVRVTFVNSAKWPRLQICDLMMGAAGSHGNKMHQRRGPGQRGMNPKQRLRHSVSLYIYNQLRQLDADERGTAGFNWFETTGLQGDSRNMYLHKIRIWKFQPRHFVIDKGWQNDHLDKQGLYVAPDMAPPTPPPTGAPEEYGY